MINNSCNSGSVQFDKAVRRWNNDILKSFSDLLTDLLAMNDKFLDCCEETNGNYQDIINQLDVLIQNLIDCCEAITDGLDEWIDELIKPPVPAPVYFIQWTDYICENIPEEDYPPEAEYHIIWNDYICEQVDESEIPPELVDYEIDFIDYICEQEWECDVAAEFVGCLEDEPEIDYDLLWQNYVCQVEIHEYIAAWDGYICIQECRIDVSGIEVDCEDITTTIEITTTETPTTTIDPLYNCVEYGYLYNWYAATDIRKISSSDEWSVPALTDFDTLMTYIDPDGARTANDAGKPLKEIGTTYWASGNTGTNIYDFNARGAARRAYTGAFSGGGVGNVLPGTVQVFHTSTVVSGDNSWYITLSHDNDRMNIAVIVQGKKYGYSTRLVSDATGVADGTTTTYVGNDGKTYSAIAINGLYWTQYNLAETEYRNGDPIPTVEDNTTWAGLTTGAKCAYNNNYEYVGCDEEGPGTTTEPVTTTEDVTTTESPTTTETPVTTVEPTTTQEVTTTEDITTTSDTTTTQELTTTTEEITTTIEYEIFSNTICSGNIGTSSEYIRNWAQNITSSAGIIEKVRIGLKRTGSPEFDLRCHIYEGHVAVNGTAPSPNSLAGTSTNEINSFELPTSDSEYFDFIFNSVSVGTTYTIVFEIFNRTLHDGFNYGLFAFGDKTDDGGYMVDFEYAGSIYNYESPDSSSCLDIYFSETFEATTTDEIITTTSDITTTETIDGESLTADTTMVKADSSLTITVDTIESTIRAEFDALNVKFTTLYNLM